MLREKSHFLFRRVSDSSGLFSIKSYLDGLCQVGILVAFADA